jgi:hypothetical protein
MTETLGTVAETAICRTCDFQVTAFSSRIALQRAGNTSRISLSSSLMGGAMLFAVVWLQLLLHSSFLLCG